MGEAAREAMTDRTSTYNLEGLLLRRCRTLLKRLRCENHCEVLFLTKGHGFLGAS